MQSCCLEGCESYKFVSKQKIGYYRFPFDNKPLLDRWLNQIRIPDWTPTETHYICSTHFHVDDIDFSSGHPKLKENAIPVIFPLKHFQNIYRSESDSVQEIPNRKNSQNIMKMNLVDYKNTAITNAKNSSTILLCTPTQMLDKNLSTQINLKPKPNFKVKNIPLKVDKPVSNINPYILIVSDNTETEIPITKVSKNKPAVLKIQIEKKVNNVLCNLVVNNTTSKNDLNNKKNNDPEEITIEDVSSTKTVVFKFDPLTGEITVQKKDKLSNKIENFEKNSNTDNTNSFSSNITEDNNIKMHNNSQESMKNLQSPLNEKTTSPCRRRNIKNTELNKDVNLIKKVELNKDAELNKKVDLTKEVELSKNVETSAKEPQILTLNTDPQKLSNKLIKLQDDPINAKDTKIVTNKQNSNLKNKNIEKKRKAEVVLTITSGDETEQKSNDIKKLKNNSNTVLLKDKAVITIIE